MEILPGLEKTLHGKVNPSKLDLPSLRILILDAAVNPRQHSDIPVFNAPPICEEEAARNGQGH